VRAEATCTFGVTGLVELGRVAGAFGLDYEPVSYGHTLCQAANLHVMLASPRTSYFELPFPVEPWEYGVVEPLRPDHEGMVAAPSGPGLGVALDWEWVRAHAAARLDLPE
jgi:L-alanine-DL-glutamate epimerase-like enolase superfamily enzyme